MPLNFPSLDEQEQMSVLIGTRTLADKNKEQFFSMKNALDLDLRTVFKVYDANKEGRLNDKDRSFFEEHQPLFSHLNAWAQSSDRYHEVLEQSKKSQFPSVVEAAWDDTDKLINAIISTLSETGRADLHNSLYALSTGPMKSGKDFTEVTFANGKAAHYQTADFFDTHNLVSRTGTMHSGAFSGKPGKSVLSETGAEILQRLNMNGQSSWEAEAKAPAQRTPRPKDS